MFSAETAIYQVHFKVLIRAPQKKKLTMLNMKNGTYMPDEAQPLREMSK